MNLADLRREYTKGGLRRGDLDPNPLVQFQKWFEQALNSQLLEPSAMTLATADKAGQPSARIVLLKAVDERGFVFFTNYESRKGRELAENPRASLLFYWQEAGRQVRVEGSVERVSPAESDAYFSTRPRGAQLAALASRQSEPPESREALAPRF